MTKANPSEARFGSRYREVREIEGSRNRDSIVAQFLPQGKESEGKEGLGLEGFEGILAETNKSRRIEERLKAITNG